MDTAVWETRTTLVSLPSRSGAIRVFEVHEDDAPSLVSAVRAGATLEDIVESGSWIYSVDFSVVI